MFKNTMNYIEPTQEEINVVNKINPIFLEYLEQSREQCDFLYSLIYRKKPNKVLEVGVSSGASSVIILNALKENPKSHLYSVDYYHNYYLDKTKSVGFVMDNYLELKKQWTLFTGGVVASFMEEIGNEIDVLFLDAAHLMPGEVLDFIMVLPYLKEDCTLILHDTNLQTIIRENTYQGKDCIATHLLMSCVVGKKLFLSTDKDYFEDKQLLSNDVFPNMGAIELNTASRENIWNVFNVLNLPWSYMPKEKDFTDIMNCLHKFYDKYYSDMFEKTYYLHKANPGFLPS